MVSNGNSYSTPNFLVSFSDTGTYAVTQVVSNEFGCSDELTQYLEVRPISEVFVPNSFTPGNRDNLNGVFKPVASNISNYKLMIFNRWGELVFSSVEIDQGWDGKIRSSKVDAKNDVYVWKIEYWDHIGTERQLLGHVTLIR
jgi:gliding motility-associated-like protein